MPETKNNASVGAFLWAVKGHWFTLMSGGIITVLLGVFERFSGKNVPLWVYASVLIFFAFLACYLAWRDAQRELVRLTDKSAFKREFLAERLRALLRNVEEARNTDRGDTIFGGFISREWLPLGHHKEIRDFLVRYYNPETVERFDKGGISVIEDLLADCYRNETTKSNTNNA